MTRTAIQILALAALLLLAGCSTPQPKNINNVCDIYDEYYDWYNASKGWMITATKTMAVELASAGIRVNALCPVAGETPLLASFMGEDTPEMRAKFLATIPLGRFSQPQDMGEAAAFLCSDAASMITGVALEVDGGRCI